MDKQVAVLMTCYNRVETTIRCLDNLQLSFRQLVSKSDSDKWIMDVFLVDDASPDRTGEKVRHWNDANETDRFNVHVIDGTGNLFWCRGMHLAWSFALRHEKERNLKYDFFLWLNDDVQLKADALGNVISDYDRLGGVIVGKFSSGEGDDDISYGLKDGRFMNGNFVLVPEEVVEKVGMICGRYHHQYGDYDYGLHVCKAGLSLNSSTQVCGVCPQQPERYKHLAGKSLLQRIKLLWDPRGYDLHDAVLYRYRNWGVLRSFLSAAHVVWIVLRG